MAGLRIRWIDVTDQANPQLGSLALRAYDRLGKWASNGNAKWRRIINARSSERLYQMGFELNRSFQKNPAKTPVGAPCENPRVIIEHPDTLPTDLSQASVDAYHRKHFVIIEQDGQDYTKLVFDANPLNPNPLPYMVHHSLDADEADSDDTGTIDDTAKPRSRRRAKRMFAMMLLTKCR